MKCIRKLIIYYIYVVNKSFLEFNLYKQKHIYMHKIN